MTLDVKKEQEREEMEKGKRSLLLIAHGALIAAAYVVLVVVFAPVSFDEAQIRVAEALTILPMFTAAAVPGLSIGCLIANVVDGAPLPDVVFGSLATFVGAAGTRRLKHKKPFLAVLPPIAANALVVPFILRYAYGVALPIPWMMASVSLGEAVSCGILGSLLYKALHEHREDIFGPEEEDS